MTTDARPRLTGQADPGRLVQVYDATERLFAVGTTDASGDFTGTPLATLSPGTYVVRAVEVGPAGTFGPATSPYTLTVLAPPPTGLALLPADDTGGPGVTAITQPRLTGRAPANTLVQVYDQDVHLIASGTAGPDGTFVAAVRTPLAPGTYTLKAVAIDPGDRYGLPGSPFSLTILPPPAAPTGLTLLPADDTGGPGRTSITQPRLTGRAGAGLLVQVYDGQTLIASGTAGSNGTFTVKPVKALSVGVHTLRAVAVDAGGHYGANGPAFALTIT